MADPEVVRLLRDRYGLVVNFQPLGSYELARIPTGELNARGIDCVWPASASAQAVFEAEHADEFPQYDVETVLQSPEVIYAGPRGSEALARAGLVTVRDGRQYLDIRRLLLEYVLTGRTWESIGTPDLRGPIAITTTDAARSNGGFTMTLLELNVIATDDVTRAPSAKQAQPSLSTVRAIYDAQGPLTSSPDLGFSNWLRQGGEDHAPLYAGYENQLIQYQIAAGPITVPITDSVRLIYPEPTLRNDHPILALNNDAKRLITAMKDPDVQAVAWKTYGFRSGTGAGPDNVADFAGLPLAQQIRTTAPPNAEVTLMLLACIQDATRC